MQDFIDKGREKIMLGTLLTEDNMFTLNICNCCCKRNGHNKNQTCWEKSTTTMQSLLIRFRSMLYRAFTNKCVSIAIDLLVWIGTIILIIEIPEENVEGAPVRLLGMIYIQKHGLIYSNNHQI